jgi:hypothetical protein
MGLNESDLSKAELERAAFVSHWYSSKVTTIEEFCEVADKDDRIKFKAGDVAKEDHQKVRQMALRHILGNIDRSDPKAKPNFGEPYSKFVKRTRDASAKWHIRRLPKTTSNSSVDFGQAAFEAAHKGFKPAKWD